MMPHSALRQTLPLVRPPHPSGKPGFPTRWMQPDNGDVKLLCLIRFIPLGNDQLTAWEAAELFAAGLEDAGGTEINREDLQSMLLFADPARCLQLLSDTLDAGEEDGFALSAGLAQGIHSRATVASSLSGFTEGSIEALFEIAATAGPQEVAISARLSSIISLSAPYFADRFILGAGLPDSRIRAPLVMGPSKRGPREMPAERVVNWPQIPRR